MCLILLTAQSLPVDPCWRHNAAVYGEPLGRHHLLFLTGEPPPAEQTAEEPTFADVTRTALK